MRVTKAKPMWFFAMATLSHQRSNFFLKIPATMPWPAGTAIIFRIAKNCLLEIFAAPVTLHSCRFTSFIAINAGKTAKSLSAQAMARMRNARIAIRKNLRRNCQHSLRPLPGTNHIPEMAAGVAGDIAVAAAAVTDIEGASQTNFLRADLRQIAHGPVGRVSF
jgi:hypothetical protein